MQVVTLEGRTIHRALSISNIDGTIVSSVSSIPFILLIAKSELLCCYIVALATILSYILEQAVFMLG